MNIGTVFFRLRSYTPIPVIIAMFAIPTELSLWAPAGSLALTVVIGGGLLLLVLGEAIRLVSVAYSSPSTRTRNVGASRLFSNGPYARVRNPLYIGNFFILAGLLVMSWTWFPWLLILAAALCLVQYAFIVRLEETALMRDLGDDYVDYKSNVPRFIPRLTPWAGASGREPDYRKAWKSEKNSLRAELAMLILIAIRWYVILS